MKAGCSQACPHFPASCILCSLCFPWLQSPSAAPCRNPNCRKQSSLVIPSLTLAQAVLQILHCPIPPRHCAGGKTFIPALQAKHKAQLLQLTLHHGNAPKRQNPPKKQPPSLQGTPSTLRSVPQCHLQPQVRTVLTISHFGCCGTVLGQHGAPGQQSPPLDGAGAEGRLGQPALPLAHLRAGGVPVGIRLQLRAAGKVRWKRHFRGHSRGTFQAAVWVFQGKSCLAARAHLTSFTTVIMICRCSPAELCPFPTHPGFAPMSSSWNQGAAERDWGETPPCSLCLQGCTAG